MRAHWLHSEGAHFVVARPIWSMLNNDAHEKELWGQGAHVENDRYSNSQSTLAQLFLYEIRRIETRFEL